MRFLTSTFDDILAGLRLLRRDRATAVLAIVTLAIGLGSVTAIFSALYGSILKPLPFRNPDELVLVGDRESRMGPGQVAGNIALTNVRDLARVTTTLVALVPYRDASVTIAGRGEAATVRAQDVGAGFFAVLGQPMLAGRDIGPADDTPGAPPVVVVSESFWRDRLESAAPGVTLDVDGVPHTVVGVAGRITQLGNPQVFRPLRPDDRGLRRNARQVYAVGRLAPGVSIGAARAELSARFEDLRRTYPEIGVTRAVGVMPIAEWLIGERGRSLLWLLAGAVAFVLVIACVNVTNLLLVRAERRQADFAMRAALGATRLRLLREMAAESLALSLAGAALGLLFAMWCVRLLVDLYGTVLPRAWEITLDLRVLAVTCAVAIASALAVVLIPAARLPRTAVRPALSADSRSFSRTSRAQRVLIAGETGLAMTLLALAGLLVNTVAQLSAHDPGVRTDRAVLFDVSVAGRQPSDEATRAFVDTLLARLAALPGVEHAAAATRRPLFGGGNSGFAIAGRESTPGFLEVRDITPRYFEALGVPILSGRPLEAADQAGARASGVVVVNQAFERAHFPGASALGQRITVSTTPTLYEIVGVAADIREFGPTGDPRPTAYFPYGSGPFGTSTYLALIATARSGNPIDLIPHARRTLHELDPHVALANPITLADQAHNRIGRDRLAVRALLSLAGGLALLLTVVGLYGVTSYGVARRTREIGIRRALGATPGSVVALMFRQALSLAAPGLVLGLLAAVGGGRLVESYLHNVRPADPFTLAAAGAVLLAAVGIACWIPSRRAARVQAAEALRL